MSTPAVAGILAVALSKSGSIAPVDLSAALIQNAKPIVTGEPDGTTYVKTFVNKVDADDLFFQRPSG